MRIFIILFCIGFLPASLLAQISFYKIYNPSAGVGDVQCFDGLPTWDGGYITTGIGAFGGGVSRPVLLKYNCKGGCEWGKYFGTSSTIANVFMRVIPTADSGYCMLNNVGTYGGYNILVVKVNKYGTTQWKKIINNGLYNDIGQNIITTKDGGFLVVGATSSFGADSLSTSYADVLAVKLDGNGNKQWAYTYGNKNATDEATAVVQTSDDGFAITGRYITTGAFYAMLLKINNTGTVQYLKTYGDTLHANYGLDIKQAGNGDLLLCGTTTLLQNSFADYTDHFVIRTNTLGDTLFTKAYYGTGNNSFESPLSMELDAADTIYLGGETASYPTVGFVPNKQVALKIAPNGVLKQAVTYSNGQGHYARLHQALDKGFTLVGFTTLNAPANFRTNIIKLNSNLAAVCNAIDRTTITNTGQPNFKIYNPAYIVSSGSNIINTVFEGTFAVTDSTLCANYPTIKAGFNFSNTCANSPITFTSTTEGSTYYHWRFGNGDTVVTYTNSTTYKYLSTGTYTVTLYVSNGCDVDSISKTITISPPPVFYIIQTPDPAVAGDYVVLGTNIIGSPTLWSTGANSNSVTINTGGQYYVTTVVNGCTVTDTIEVNITNTSVGNIFIPTIFTPNNDGKNDYFESITKGYEQQSMVVYNRVGNKVFSTTKATEYWDGKYLSVPAANDVYYYYAIFKYGKFTEVRKGDVLLVR